MCQGSQSFKNQIRKANESPAKDQTNQSPDFVLQLQHFFANIHMWLNTVLDILIQGPVALVRKTFSVAPQRCGARLTRAAEEYSTTIFDLLKAGEMEKAEELLRDMP